MTTLPANHDIPGTASTIGEPGKKGERSGLFPLVSPSCKVLILGSYPSLISLQAGEYYANPRNGFWKIMAAAFGFMNNLSYPERVSLLNAQGIGLWDVFASCVRKKSADATITSGIPNDIPGLLTKYPKILAIGLNGRAAEKGFRENFTSLSFPIFYLPSSSPAHAISFEEKTTIWLKKIQPFLKMK